MLENNSVRLRQRSNEQLENVPFEEKVAWLAHPCTRGLLLGLEADIEEIKEAWSNGNYITDLENYKQIGMVQATDSIIEWVTDIVERAQ